MQKSKGNTIKLGIFVSVGIALFIAAIYFIGERQQLFSSTFAVSGIFKDISGLQVGNNVRFSGINVGTIDNIQQISDSTVSVNMIINEHTRKFIKKNAKAVIGSDGLMGNKIVLIIPGTSSSKEIANNDIIETVVPINMDDILLNIKITSENAATITADLSSIMDNISAGKGMVGKLFMDDAFAQNAGEAIANIKQGAVGFKQNMDAAKHNFLLKGYYDKKEKQEIKKAKQDSIKKLKGN